MPVYDDEKEKVDKLTSGNSVSSNSTSSSSRGFSSSTRASRGGSSSSTGRNKPVNTGFFNPEGDGETGSSTSLKPAGLSVAENNVAGLGAGGRFRFNPSDQTTKGKIKMMLRGNTKRNVTIGGLFVGGAVGAVFIFISFLPLRIVSSIADLQNTYGAATDDAVGQEGEHLLDRYLISRVLPHIGGRCHSTISKECSFAKSTGTGPVPTLFNAWHENRIENKLATNYGVVLGRKGNSFYINTGSKDISLGTHPSSIFEMPGTSTATRAEVRATISKAVEGETLWKRVYLRHLYGEFAQNKYGVRRCVITCKISDKYADKIAVRKVAARAYITRRIISPFNENYGLIMQCILGGDFCDTHLKKATSDNEDRLSPFQKKLQEQLSSFAARYGADALKDLVDQSNVIAKDGLSKTLTKQIAKKIGASLGKDVSGDAAAKAVPIVGWIFLLARLAHTANTIGPTLQYMGYAVKAAAAVSTYQLFASVAAETKSNHIDIAELGSFNSALSTNLTGANEDQSDATQVPLYSSLYGSKPAAVSLLPSDILSPSAYAASSSPEKSYKCNNNKGPSGLICPEANFAQGVPAATAISNFTKGIPGVGFVSGIITKIGDATGSVFGAIFNAQCHTVGRLYGCPKLVGVMGEKVAGLLKLVTEKLIVSPFSKFISGGSLWTMMAGGANVFYNSACHLVLGCAKISDKHVSEIRNKQIAQQEAEFNSQPLFARLFSTKTPYSLVSRLAMNMPTNIQSVATSGLNSLFSDPIARYSSLLASVFSSNRAFAAASPQSDPFGVVQYGYTKDQIPQDPEAYWNAHCQGDYTTSWLNSQKQDQNTGEAVATTPNPCMLIKAAAGSVGGIFDPSLLPPDSLNGDSGSSGSTGGTIPSGSAQELAKEIVDSGKVTGDSRYMSQIQNVANGDFSCNVNPSILKMLVGIVRDGHSLYVSSLNRMCTGVLTRSGAASYHYRDGGGHAIDVTSFDGHDVNGKHEASTLGYLNEAAKYLPSGAGFGQVLSCNSGFKIPSGGYAVPDSCDHQHIQVPVQRINQ